MTTCICTGTGHSAVQTLSRDFIFRKDENLFWGGGSVRGNLQRKSGAFQIPVAEENMKKGRSIYYLMVYGLRSFKHDAPYVLHCQVG
jgi:hypothetical protein